MNSSERAQWIWEHEKFECRACRVKAEMDKVKYERERKYYERAKTQLYPREQPKQDLKRLNSEERWEGTPSFYKSWKMPSTLAHLMQPFVGERKGTGFVGDSNETTTGVEGDGAGGSTTHAQLEMLDEEMEMVEEESIRDSDSDSLHSGGVNLSGGTGLPSGGNTAASSGGGSDREITAATT